MISKCITQQVQTAQHAEVNLSPARSASRVRSTDGSHAQHKLICVFSISLSLVIVSQNMLDVPQFELDFLSFSTTEGLPCALKGETLS